MNTGLINSVFQDNPIIEYKRGETICKQGAYANQLVLITSGVAKLYLEHKGKNVIIRITKQGDILGYHNLFHENLFAFSVAAITNCKVKAIGFEEFQELIENRHDLYQEVIKQSNSYTSEYFNRFISLTQKQLHGRLADAIIHLSKEVYKSEEFDLHLTRKDIAEFTGMSTESAIRIMKEFHNDKIINLNGKKLSIISMSLLEKLSDLG